MLLCANSHMHVQGTAAWCISLRVSWGHPWQLTKFQSTSSPSWSRPQRAWRQRRQIRRRPLRRPGGRPHPLKRPRQNSLLQMERRLAVLQRSGSALRPPP